MIICIAEDRISEIDPVKLLIHSISKHCDPIPAVRLVFPPADTEFINWLETYPNVELSTRPISEASGWDIKPYILDELLAEGHTKVLWLDSDIIVNANICQLFCRYSEQTLVVSEEPKVGQIPGGAIRTENWGFEVGRTFERTVNGGLIFCTRMHRTLFENWKILLQSKDYREAQSLPWNRRPIHLLGDQDLLTALLGSRRWCHVPVEFLPSGKVIVQELGPGGYSVLERLSNMGRGLPAFAHAMKLKPWRFKDKPSFLREPKQYYYALNAELSVYTHLARTLAKEMDLDAPWMKRCSLPSLMMKIVAIGEPSLAGLPLAVVDWAAKTAKRALGIDNVLIGPGSNKR